MFIYFYFGCGDQLKLREDRKWGKKLLTLFLSQLFNIELNKYY